MYWWYGFQGILTTVGLFGAGFLLIGICWIITYPIGKFFSLDAHLILTALLATLTAVFLIFAYGGPEAIEKPPQKCPDVDRTPFHGNG